MGGRDPAALLAWRPHGGLIAPSYNLQLSELVITEIAMRKLTYVASFLVVFCLSSCATAPVGAKISRAWCETEAKWIGGEWHLTEAEAEAQVQRHLCDHPDHVVGYISTSGSVTEETANAPLIPVGRDIMRARNR